MLLVTDQVISAVQDIGIGLKLMDVTKIPSQYPDSRIEPLEYGKDIGYKHFMRMMMPRV